MTHFPPPEQITIIQTMLLLEAEGLKEHPAPWLKNSKTVFRGPGGRFASKSGGGDGATAEEGDVEVDANQVAATTQSLIEGGAAAMERLEAAIRVGAKKEQMKLASALMSDRASLTKVYRKHVEPMLKDHLPKGESVEEIVDSTLSGLRLINPSFQDTFQKSLKTRGIDAFVSEFPKAVTATACTAVAGGLMAGPVGAVMGLAIGANYGLFKAADVFAKAMSDGAFASGDLKSGLNAAFGKGSGDFAKSCLDFGSTLTMGGLMAGPGVLGGVASQAFVGINEELTNPDAPMRQILGVKTVPKNITELKKEIERAQKKWDQREAISKKLTKRMNVSLQALAELLQEADQKMVQDAKRLPPEEFEEKYGYPLDIIPPEMLDA